MNKPSRGQVLNALSVLMNNANWDNISSSNLQKVIDFPLQTGQHFTAFLNAGARIAIQNPVEIPSLKVFKESYPLDVDYFTSFPEVVRLSGYETEEDQEFSILSAPCTKVSSIDGEVKEKVTAKICQISCDMWSPDIVRLLNKKRLRPANAEELLAFGARYRHQVKETVVALGTHFEFYYESQLVGKSVACLTYRNDDTKLVSSDSLDSIWKNDLCSFLAIRKD